MKKSTEDWLDLLIMACGALIVVVIAWSVAISPLVEHIAAWRIAK